MKTVGLVINTETAAPSQYAGFNFNSACVFNGVVLFASSAGLFTNTGSTDNTTKISALFQVPSTNLGLRFRKILRRLYLTGAFEKFLKVTSVIDDVNQSSYTITCPVTITETQVKANIHHGDAGNLIGFEIANVDGSDFSVDIIEATIHLSNLQPKAYNQLGRTFTELPSMTGAASGV